MHRRTLSADPVADRPPVAKGRQVRHQVLRVLRAGPARAAPEVGCEEDVVEAKQRVVVGDRLVEEHVETRAREMRRLASASTSASSSTTPPRQVLTRNASGFIRASAGSRR